MLISVVFDAHPEPTIHFQFQFPGIVKMSLIPHLLYKRGF